MNFGVFLGQIELVPDDIKEIVSDTGEEVASLAVVANEGDTTMNVPDAHFVPNCGHPDFRRDHPADTKSDVCSGSDGRWKSVRIVKRFS